MTTSSRAVSAINLPRARALQDLADGVRQWRLAFFLAWEDVRQRYVRTMLGPFWIVISTAIWSGAMGFVMASLFNQDMAAYLPYMVNGLLVWTLISSSVNESSQALIGATPIISSFPLPISLQYLRFALRNLIIFLHNVVILLLVWVFFPPSFSAVMWLALPGMVVVMLALIGMSMIISLLNLRYRDTQLAIASGMQVLPFVTPVFWDRGMLTNHHWIADINPFYHLLEIVRGPLLGQTPSLLSWQVAGGTAAVSLLIGTLMFIRYRHRIIFWL